MSERDRPEPKAEALEKHGVLNPQAGKVSDERFHTEEFFDARDLVQVKYEMVRRVHSEGWTVTEAARVFGFSRPTFYQAQESLASEGLPGLLPKRPGPKGARKLTEEVLRVVDDLRIRDPSMGAEAVSHHVRDRFGLSVHPRSIERALARREKKRRRSR
jgi:transposase